MKIMKRVLAIVLASVLVIGLAACGSTATETTEAAKETETAKVTEAAKETEAVTEAAAETGEKSLYGGDERITLTVGVAKKENVTDFEDNYFTKWIEEKCNVDLDFQFFSYNSDENLTQIATMMAANEKLPDILWGITFPDEIRAEYDTDGYFVDMNQWLGDSEFIKDYDSFQLYSDPNYVPATNWELFTKRNLNIADGGWYHIGNFSSGSADNMYSKMYINQDWLKKLGLETPTNFEEFKEVLRAFRDKDPNGNGQADEIPLIGAVNTCEKATAWDDPVRWLLNNWVFYNENYLFNAEQGKLILPAQTDEYREGLKNIKGLVDENLLSTMVYTINETSELKALYFPEDNVQKVGCFSGHIVKVNVTDHPGLYQYTWLNPFKYAPMNQATVGSSVCISADCEYPERAMKVILATNSVEGSMVQRYGQKGVDWEEIDDPVDGHKVMNVINNDAFSGQTNITWALASTAMTKSNDPWRLKSIEYKEPVTDMAWADYKTYLSRTPLDSYMEIGDKNNPEETVGWFALSDEEAQELGSIKTDYITFIRQARAEFLTGVRDINSDADWAAYLDQCKMIGSETLLSVSQKAYTRLKQ